MINVVDNPLVSVIVPAFQARKSISDSLKSVVLSGLAPQEVEVVVSSDDGTDYRPYAPSNLNVQFTRQGPVATGVGSARNRALELAGGTYLAFLDADDTWSEGYLKSLMPLARQSRVAFSPTEIVSTAGTVLRVPSREYLDFGVVSETGASFRPLVHRSLVGRFKNISSQDVLHTLELLSLSGGHAPLSDRPYILALREGSITSGRAFATKLEREYREIIEMIRNGETRIISQHRNTAAKVFEAKLELNGEYLRQRSYSTYYEFVANRTTP